MTKHASNILTALLIVVFGLLAVFIAWVLLVGLQGKPYTIYNRNLVFFGGYKPNKFGLSSYVGMCTNRAIRLTFRLEIWQSNGLIYYFAPVDIVDFASCDDEKNYYPETQIKYSLTCTIPSGTYNARVRLSYIDRFGTERREWINSDTGVTIRDTTACI